MNLFSRSIKATLIVIPVLMSIVLVYIFATSGTLLGQGLGLLVGLAMILSVPLFLVILGFNLLFNNRHPIGRPSGSDRTSILVLSAIGSLIAGSYTAFHDGTIGYMWLVMALAGGIVGGVSGAIKK